MGVGIRCVAKVGMRAFGDAGVGDTGVEGYLDLGVWRCEDAEDSARA